MNTIIYIAVWIRNILTHIYDRITLKNQEWKNILLVILL